MRIYNLINGAILCWVIGFGMGYLLAKRKPRPAEVVREVVWTSPTFISADGRICMGDGFAVGEISEEDNYGTS